MASQEFRHYRPAPKTPWIGIGSAAIGSKSQRLPLGRKSATQAGNLSTRRHSIASART